MARSPSTLGTLLAGHLALVTGGSSGIGRAVSSVLAREGAKVIVADVDVVSAENALRSLPDAQEHQFVEVDVSKANSVSNLFEQIGKLYSMAPNIVVNCAGIARESSILKMSETTFDEVIGVNLKGTYLICQGAAKSMVANSVQNGSLINISSIVGKTGNKGHSNYAASKAAVVGFTKSASLELAKFGIRCNAILPGFIETPMVSPIPARFVDDILRRTPLQRKGLPEEVADVCKFLASKNSSYVTGAAIEVTGGLSM